MRTNPATGGQRARAAPVLALQAARLRSSEKWCFKLKRNCQGTQTGRAPQRTETTLAWTWEAVREQHAVKTTPGGRRKPRAPLAISTRGVQQTASVAYDNSPFKMGSVSAQLAIVLHRCFLPLVFVPIPACLKCFSLSPGSTRWMNPGHVPWLALRLSKWFGVACPSLTAFACAHHEWCHSDR